MRINMRSDDFFGIFPVVSTNIDKYRQSFDKTPGLITGKMVPRSKVSENIDKLLRVSELSIRKNAELCRKNHFRYPER